LGLFGMTTSISSVPAVAPSPAMMPTEPATETPPLSAERPQTFASRFVFLTICVAVVMTTLAFGTVHYWALAVFSLSAVLIVCFGVADAWASRSLRISLSPLQLPLLGLIALAVVQLLPLRAIAPDTAGLPVSPSMALSLDPYATRLFIVQVASLLIYFGATLIFTDTPERLRLLVRTIMIFGFVLAIFGLTQSLTTGGSKVYWFRELTQSTAFGPFINRHHFAGYMELTVALPLGLLFSGAVERDRRVLYAFAVALMGIGLILTNSRGGMLSLGAEIIFLGIVASVGSKRSRQRSVRANARAAMMRAGLAFALVAVLIGGALYLGGSDAFSRLLGTPTASDPTTGRAHFWNVTLDIIKAHPWVGTGLGAFGVVYTRYDSHNGLFRLEQAHNDYLQILSDGGMVGAVLGLAFVVILFRKGFARRETGDPFRRGVTTGALAGCFAVLVHSFFDFTLHTTANALLFLIMAAIATQDTRVDKPVRRRRRRRRSHSHAEESEAPKEEPQALDAGAADRNGDDVVLRDQ
jgi:O-antigen ligase